MVEFQRRNREADFALSQPCLDSARQGAKVRYALQLVVRQLHVKMVLESGQQIQSLQAVNSQRFKEVVIAGELLSRNLEVSRGEVKNFIKGLISGSHKNILRVHSCVGLSMNLGQIR